MDPTCVFNFFTFFERILFKSNCIVFIFSWCATHTKIRIELVVIVTAGSQKITLWGPQRTPLGILRVKRTVGERQRKNSSITSHENRFLSSPKLPRRLWACVINCCCNVNAFISPPHLLTTPSPKTLVITSNFQAEILKFNHHLIFTIPPNEVRLQQLQQPVIRQESLANITLL